MSEKLSLESSKWVEERCQFNCDFIEAEIQDTENLYEPAWAFAIFAWENRHRKNLKICCKLAQKKKYITDWYSKKVNRVIKFNQKAWFKPYIDMSTELRKNAKIDFESNFWSWWVMQSLEKLWRMYDNIEMSSLDNWTRWNYLVSEPDYHVAKLFSELLLAIEMKITWILIKKPVYLVLWTLEISKITYVWVLV